MVPEHDETWEAIDDFQQQFPTFHLEGKVVLEGESNVTPPILYQHQQRSKGRMGNTIVKG